MTATLDILPLADLKAHARIDTSEEDPDLAQLIEAARGFVEGWCGPLDDFASPVPPALVHAMKLYAAHLYENREATSAGGVAEVPLGFFDLIDPHRLRVF
ncbi:head-tail connector protein [Xanthobacter sp. YC-JY1]|uniref:head-tail connector protein n=1 Tax=Xanthobacter sp. YC-JY1 TaxID=2419844 RepID=UPI001F00C166|nr:head-tail connector protein [Xanthobacter sp. YC-JY1]UJX47174.1 phage gp6-like head-tail connector protein [Xanthobacter sp. YC-JY1]